MIKIRTLENLNQQLTDDLIWRKQELSALKALIEIRSFSSRKHNTLLRSGITILYAHWEGYIKNTATRYLEFVSRQDLTYNELAIEFIAIVMKDKLTSAKETNKATVFNDATKFILTQTGEKSSIPYKGIIRTKSNLSSSILREITCLLGLNYSFYQSKEKFIDEKLLNRRNLVAHGESLDYLQSLDRETYIELQEQILTMMEDFRNQVENNAAQKLYLRQPNKR
jgi:hypothetical protein